MNKKSLSFMLGWVFVTTVSSIIGLAFSYSIESDRNYRPLLLLLGFTISGLLGSFCQWIILRGKIKTPLLWLWIPATVTGIPTGLFIGFWIEQFLAPLYFNYRYYLTSFSVIAIVAGLFTGALQWLALNRKSPSIIWLLLSVISFLGISVFFPSIDNHIYDFIDPANDVIMGAIYGGLAGIFTGIVSGININLSLNQKEAKPSILPSSK